MLIKEYCTEFVSVFVRKGDRWGREIRLNERNPLHNRTMHINGSLEAPEKANIGAGKANIGAEKANIGAEKANIDKIFSAKTAANVRKLTDAFGSQTVFGRSDVERVLALKPTRCSALLHELLEREMIVPVYGAGKWKYRLVLQESQKVHGEKGPEC